MEVEDVEDVIGLRIIGTETVHHLPGEAEVGPVEEDTTIMTPVDKLDQETFLPVALEVELGEGDMAVETMILAGDDIPGPEVLLQGDTDLRLLHVAHPNLLRSRYSSKMILNGMILVSVKLNLGRIFIMWRICLRNDEFARTLFSFHRGLRFRI